jgi:uncharacterized protein (DUF1501 family)
MNRRKFINNSVKACASTFFLNQLTQSSFAQSTLMKAIMASCTDNILVIVQLAGGNDGLNTIIPLDQYSKALALPNSSGGRSNILIPETKVLTLSGLSNTAFHPVMGGLRDLYNSGSMSFVQGCGYPNPDYSHFRSTDIWMTGSDSNQFLKSGWIGRELEQLYPGFPTGFPSALYPDPLAIQLGSIVSLAFEASTTSTALAVTDLSEDYELLNSYGDAIDNTRSGENLAYLRGVAIDTDKYNSRILAAAKAQSTNLSTLYGTAAEIKDNPLAIQLQGAARLIKGGLTTRVYMASMSGFDTHAAQTESDTTKGSHATLLDKVSKAISGFQDDLVKMGVNKKVTGMVFSEFGRRVNSNGSLGSDHGASMPVMLFGSELAGGMYGTNPNLKPSTTVLDNVPMQHDFRSVYYSLLKDWFCLSAAQLSNVFGGKTYPYLSLFKADAVGVHEDDVFASNSTNALADLYPNPAEDIARLVFTTSGGDVNIEIMDATGAPLRIIMNKTLSAGKHTIGIEKESLKSGLYLVKMRNGSFQETKKLVFK